MNNKHVIGRSMCCIENRPQGVANNPALRNYISLLTLHVKIKNAQVTRLNNKDNISYKIEITYKFCDDFNKCKDFKFVWIILVCR